MKNFKLFIVIIFLISYYQITLSSTPNDDLMEAIEKHDLAGVKRAVKNGADINFASDSWSTPLHAAFYSAEENKQIIYYLLEQNADIRRFDILRGHTPVHYLIKNGYYDVLKEFIEKKIIDIYIKDKFGASLLHLAVSKKNIPIMKLLLHHYSDINTVNHKNETPLHYAVIVNEYDIVKLLIDNSADPNLQDNDGNTSLHYAYRQNNKQIIELLKNNGGRVFILNKKGQIPSAMLTHAQNEKLSAAGEYVPIVWYEIMAAFPLTNLIGTPYWCAGFTNVYDVLGGLFPAMFSTSYLSLLVGIFGSIPLSYGLTEGNIDYTNAGIIMMSVGGGISYLINLIWAVIHWEGAFVNFMYARHGNNRNFVYLNYDMHNFKVAWKFDLSLFNED